MFVVILAVVMELHDCLRWQAVTYAKQLVKIGNAAR